MAKQGTLSQYYALSALSGLHVLPHGSPFSEDAPNPGRPFQ
ncbi:hypothetical protein M878_41565 [Streptomyces roseochromogenus subsp. oscitans DS 12.976]|uniref:Uncharacterized protein n=1 Tax=Streptomyces roseochromogenus subsp. oscitans DS 12.976 TaxID=1352936 RepID=V6JKQ3_STRRC|nr:hypothetical protein M878_41565 [Streptomyces roseochromogenus subsp. oscitans DS 12.976]